MCKHTTHILTHPPSARPTRAGDNNNNNIHNTATGSEYEASGHDDNPDRSPNAGEISWSRRCPVTQRPGLDRGMARRARTRAPKTGRPPT